VIAASGTSWMWRARLFTGGEVVGDLKHVPTSGCRLIRVHRSPLVTRSTTPHSQIAVVSARSAPPASAPWPRDRRRVALWGRSASSPKVALGLGEQSVGVDKLERVAARDLKGV